MGLNAPALFELLESEDGPVGRLVAANASIIRDLARGNAGDIMHRLPEGTKEIVLESIDFEQVGTTAIVGIEDLGPGSIEEYLANKELREQVWLLPAAAETFSPDNQDAVRHLLGGLARSRSAFIRS